MANFLGMDFMGGTRGAEHPYGYPTPAVAFTGQAHGCNSKAPRQTPSPLPSPELNRLGQAAVAVPISARFPGAHDQVGALFLLQQLCFLPSQVGHSQV